MIPLSSSGECSGKPFDNSHRITIDDVSLHYRIWEPEVIKHQEVCLLIHGFSGSTFSWRYTAVALQKDGYVVIAVDIPPYGYSDKNPRINHSMTAHADLLHSFMNTIRPRKQWHVFGHSMGGGIAEALVLKYPENISSVIFVAGTVFKSIEAGRSSGSFWLRLPPVQRFLSILGEHLFITKGQVSRLLASAYGQEPDNDSKIAYYNALHIPGTAEAIVRSMSASEELYPLTISTLKTPCLAVWGNKDTWVPAAQGEAVLLDVDNIRFEMIDGAAHCPMETHPEEFNSIMLDFLNNLNN